MSRRRPKRRSDRPRRYPSTLSSPSREIVREAAYVERLAYTRAQAAEALGISRSTLRRLLPYVETIEMPWGASLIPIDEVERVAAEQRRAAHAPVDPALVPPEVVERILAERAAGKSLRRIAADLNADGVRTAHGGAQWWASTVRSVLRRSRSGVTPLPFSS
jgi:hypothetical protein